MDRSGIIEHYENASVGDDFEAMRRYRHPEWHMVWPQSGEAVVGHDNYVAMRTNRPEGGGPRVEPLRHGGSGDVWWSEAVIHYGDGSRWLGVWIYEFAGDLIRVERVYFAQPFAPPAWRARWVERGQPAIANVS
jgi:hypothetical protein